MGIPTLISTATADNDSELDITSGIDSTYDEYMFVFTDIDSVDDSIHFKFQCSIDSGSNYNVAMTTTLFLARHDEGDSDVDLGYYASLDQAQGTDYQQIYYNQGSGADESSSGILHLFSPASTTYIKHFYSRMVSNSADEYERDTFSAGYFNTTSAIDAISFKMHSGNLTAGTIQMYGIA